MQVRHEQGDGSADAGDKDRVAEGLQHRRIGKVAGEIGETDKRATLVLQALGEQRVERQDECQDKVKAEQQKTEPHQPIFPRDCRPDPARRDGAGGDCRINHDGWPRSSVPETILCDRPVGRWSIAGPAPATGPASH
jgi:hypothetical protein